MSAHTFDPNARPWPNCRALRACRRHRLGASGVEGLAAGPAQDNGAGWQLAWGPVRGDLLHRQVDVGEAFSIRMKFEAYPHTLLCPSAPTALRQRLGSGTLTNCDSALSQSAKHLPPKLCISITVVADSTVVHFNARARPPWSATSGPGYVSFFPSFLAPLSLEGLREALAGGSGRTARLPGNWLLGLWLHMHALAAYAYASAVVRRAGIACDRLSRHQ